MSARSSLRRAARRVTRRLDLTPLTEWRGRGVPPGLRTAKTTLAAVISWELARRLLGESLPLLAPLTALLVTQLTVVETVTGSLQRVGSVVVGVLLAVLLADLLGLQWWSVGLVVFASLAVGQVLRLGEHRIEVPISALLVLAVGGQSGAARTRVLETLIGAAVGVAVNVVVAPPVYVQSAGDAIAELAETMARLLKDAGDELARGWSGEDAYDRLQEARELEGPLGRARHALARAEDSLRLNPRRRRIGDPSSDLQAALTTLEHSVILVRGLFRSLVDLDTVTGGKGPDPALRADLAGLLDETAGAVRAFGELVSANLPGPPANEAPLRRALGRAKASRDKVATGMAAGPRDLPGAWQVHGHLLANVDRLLIEIDPEGQTWPGIGRLS
ncbi:MAG TPA: aromatic acid exporter family protein, partial [Actinomycetota bacterium]|nr:aromatic acid exporter family protein [Actinomycetota bacterium]